MSRMDRLARWLRALALATLGLGALTACGTPPAPAPAPAPAAAPADFAGYREATRQALQAGRRFQQGEHAPELAWNLPQEWRPAAHAAGQRPARGILLVHGLGDSPWSFHDLGPQLAAQGFLVRTVLLPGHATQPADLLAVTAGQWRQVVGDQVRLLQQDVGQVYLGGFSTGGNLVLEYAYGHPEIAGLVLFSPGFKSLAFDWLAPLAARVRPWLLSPAGPAPLQNAVRYLNVPTNGFAQFYHTSVAAQALLRERPYTRPVFMVVAEHDSVLNAAYLLDVFQRRFTHPHSRLIWYGGTPAGLTDRARVLVRADRLPAQRISQFSHMGMLFSPANPLYGEQGSLRICWNGQEDAATRACEAGAAVWYSEWGYREAGKVHARLTYNPYFDWQNAVMREVLAPPAS